MIEFQCTLDIPVKFTGVCKVINSGAIYHMKDGKFHNENGPAIIRSTGTKKWCINNLLHREDGPAIEYSSGAKEWHYKNKIYGENNDFTIEAWKEFAENKKREEELRIFI